MVLERSALGESQLHDALVRLAGADQSIVRPNRNASPLPLLDHLRVSLFDESADMGERLAPPVVQFLDPRVDQPRRGFALGRCCALFHIACTSFGWFSILRESRATPRPASPSSPFAPRRARRPRGCRCSACPCPCWRRAGPVAATCRRRR